MTRFLSFVILLLHLLADIRRRVALATTAAIVMVVATIAVVGTVATGASAAVQATPASVPETHVAQPEPRAMTVLPLSSRQQSRLPALRNVTSPKVPDAPIQQNSVTSTAPPPSGATSASPSGAAVVVPPATNNPESAQIQLSASQMQCQQGQWVANVANATVAFQKPAANDDTLSWYWEVRTDGGTAPAQQLVSSTSNTQAVHAGDTTASIVSPASGQPLLSAPASATYSYSVRLHITGPFDAVSDWLSIPATNTACLVPSTAQQQ